MPDKAALAEDFKISIFFSEPHQSCQALYRLSLSGRFLCPDMIKSRGSRPSLVQGLDREVATMPTPLQ